MIKDFTELKVWQSAHQACLETYQFVEFLPNEEKFNRIDQLKRSCSSIESNIAEGFGRFHYQENIQFCRQARGSLEETRNHIITAMDLKQAPKEECEKLLNLLVETRKLLNGYIRYLKKRKNTWHNHNSSTHN